MILDDGKTYVKNNYFVIEVEAEGDCSTDGGYSFESVTSYTRLDKEEAQELIDELLDFIKE